MGENKHKSMRLEKEIASLTSFVIPKRLSWIKYLNPRIYSSEVVVYTHFDQFLLRSLLMAFHLEAMLISCGFFGFLPLPESKSYPIPVPTNTHTKAFFQAVEQPQGVSAMIDLFGQGPFLRVLS